jgi:hypothetical protein
MGEYEIRTRPENCCDKSPEISTPPEYFKNSPLLKLNFYAFTILAFKIVEAAISIAFITRR